MLNLLALLSTLNYLTIYFTHTHTQAHIYLYILVVVEAAILPLETDNLYPTLVVTAIQ